MSDLSANWWVFPGFEVQHIATGFELPVNIAFVPNPGDSPSSPFFYVSELYGGVKVVTRDFTVRQFAQGLLNYEPDYRFPGTGESGLIGIAVEPSSGDVFVSMIYEEEGQFFSRVQRLVTHDGLSLNKIETVIDGIPSVHAAHQIQAITFGPDGKLYVNTGDGMIDRTVAQRDDDLRGKILRLNPGGSVPDDNPIPGSYVFAKGLRNPFGAAWRKSDGHLYISDNGPEKDDRIAKIVPGSNYGWPETMRQNSLFIWHYTQAPTAIDFMQNGSFPEEFNDELFVALFGMAYALGPSEKGKKIIKLRLNEDATAVLSYDHFVVYKGEGPASPCGLAFGPDGLYFTDLHGEKDGSRRKASGNVYRVVPKN